MKDGGFMVTLQNTNTVRKSTTNIAAKIGAIFYIMWGILHIYVGIMVLSKLLAHGLPIGTDAGRSVMYFWLATIIGVQATLIGIFLNWRNDRAGYWLNMGISTAGDVGLVIFMMIPGNLPFDQGISGPILWAHALIFSTYALIKGGVIQSRRTTEEPRDG